jgi:hypothetical protein
MLLVAAQPPTVPMAETILMSSFPAVRVPAVLVTVVSAHTLLTGHKVSPDREMMAEILRSIVVITAVVAVAALVLLDKMAHPLMVAMVGLVLIYLLGLQPPLQVTLVTTLAVAEVDRTLALVKIEALVV